jgi:hypothetical protein
MSTADLPDLQSGRSTSDYFLDANFLVSKQPFNSLIRKSTYFTKNNYRKANLPFWFANMQLFLQNKKPSVETKGLKHQLFDLTLCISTRKI